MQVWLSYMKKTTITKQMKRKSMAQRTDTRRNLKIKAHLTGEFVIVVKFGSYAMHHLASRLANVIRRGRGGRLKPSFSDFLKNTYLSFYNCCIVLCTIYVFSNIKVV